MKRKEFYLIVGPLTEKLYRFAYALLPEELQAEQLVIDGFNAYLFKEKKNILRKEVTSSSKDFQVLGKIYFKGILGAMVDIGVRRSSQLSEQMRLDQPTEFKTFYQLDPKLRAILSLRFDAQLTVDEIGEITQMAKYEVIEKLHNGRFLLLNKLNKGTLVHG